MSSQKIAVTQYIKANNGITFAYRQLGISEDIPLVMQIHFRANMDFWDPLLLSSLSSSRRVIIFDQAGVGKSTGEVPRTFQGWADDMIAFVEALQLDKIDLFGFSMGGCAVQMVALTAPQLVHKLILAGTGPSAPTSSSPTGIVWPREVAPPKPIELLSTAATFEETRHAIAYSFFPLELEEGRIAAEAYWQRISKRPMANESPLLELLDHKVGAKNQRASYRDWDKPNPHNSFDRLGELKMPVLVLNGDNDILIPTSRSWELMRGIPHAQLILYPQAGHGFLYQHAELVAMHINMFLDGSDCGCAQPRL